MNTCVCSFVLAGWVLVRNGIVSGKTFREYQNNILRFTLK